MKENHGTRVAEHWEPANGPGETFISRRCWATRLPFFCAHSRAWRQDAPPLLGSARRRFVFHPC